MCETRDLGFEWPHWHTLIFSDETRIDVRFVRPRDVKKMLVQRARSVYWKKCDEHEELKEGAWLEPAPALLRKQVKGDWTEKQCNVARKIFLEGGWTQKRLFDIVGRMTVNVKPAKRRKAQKSIIFTSPEWHEIWREIPEAFRKWEQKVRTSK